MPLNHTSSYAELTSEQYAAIGRLVVEWSNIEYQLSVLLSRLLRTPEYLGRTYSAGLSAARIQEAIDEAIDVHRTRYGCQLVTELDLQAIESTNHRITALRAQRNKISHFCWCRSDDDRVFGTSFRGGVPSKQWERRNSATLSLSELEGLYVEARELSTEIMRVTSIVAAVDERIVPSTST